MAGCGLTCLRKKYSLLILTAILHLTSLSGLKCQEFDESDEVGENGLLKPTVFVAILVRNKAHVLPWFLGQFEVWNYPKDRMALWIRSDHNADNSTSMVKEWLAANEHYYKSVDFQSDDSSKSYTNEKGVFDWTPERFDHVINLREEALLAARNSWADYLLMLDADVIIQNLDTLQLLIDQKKSIVGPMLNASIGENYSNFWGGITTDGYYKRVAEYFDIVERTSLGCFSVPLVHTMYLMNLKHAATTKLSYKPWEGYNLGIDDIVIFAQSAMANGVKMHVLNTEYFGQVMLPLDDWNKLADDKEHHDYIRIEVLDMDNPDMSPGVDYEIETRGLLKSPHIYVPPIPTDTLGFDHIYMINLERRPERRTRMNFVLSELGIEAEWVEAVDGRRLNDSYIEEQGIEILPGFADPYDGRAMKLGEIGCFLSHYNIWKDMVAKKYKSVVVFEDDLRLEPYFKFKLRRTMMEAARVVPDWELIYLGRKRLKLKEEKYVTGTTTLVWPSYSYWTLSYTLTYEGAVKLLDQNPLPKMVPVDEYLPIMFDKHPEDIWKEKFGPRNLVALSADPLLIYPTHYLGEAFYISDTEDSEIIPTEDEEGVDVADDNEQPDLTLVGSHGEGQNLEMDATVMAKDEL